MKKTLTLIMVLFAATTLWSQADVTSAYMANKDGDYEKAAMFIEKGIQNEKAKTKPKTWIYRGNIYYNICTDSVLLRKFPDALVKSKESYVEAMRLDKKGTYKTEAEAGLSNVKNASMTIGINFYNASDFLNAADHFVLSNEVMEMFDQVDSMAVFNAAISYEKAEKWEKAIVQYKKCGELSYNVPDVYLFIIGIQRKQGNEDAALETVKMARTKFPNDQDLIIEELNYYLTSGNDEEAQKNLELALSQDPDNKILNFALGTIYDKIGLGEKAIVSYEKAIAIDENYFDALYNLGAYYFNDAVAKINIANEIPPSQQKKYEAAMEEASVVFNLAIPYLTRALEIKPEDGDTLRSLKDAYARTGDDDNYNKIKEMLGE